MIDFMLSQTKPIQSDDITPPSVAQKLDAFQKEEFWSEAAANRQHLDTSMTYRLNTSDQTYSFVDSVQPAFGYRIGAASEYMLLPVGLSPISVPDDQPVWRIELHGLSPGDPLGIDVAGDVLIGRGVTDQNHLDLDLVPYGGYDYGVSRRHALLRPSVRCLYLIDLGSTNGTQQNARLIDHGVARALKNNDTITFGLLSLTIKIIDGPVDS